MTEKDFAKMSITELKDYGDLLNQRLTIAYRRMRERALQTEIEKKSQVNLGDFLTREISEGEFAQMDKATLKKYCNFLEQELEMVRWFLRYKSMH